jgi:hypothetical protein
MTERARSFYGVFTPLPDRTEAALQRLILPTAFYLSRELICAAAAKKKPRNLK